MEEEGQQRGQRVKEIVRYQFDLEILHKWHEIRLIEGELERGRRLRLLLEKLILNEYVHGGAHPNSEPALKKFSTCATAGTNAANTNPTNEDVYSSHFGISLGRRSTRYAASPASSRLHEAGNVTSTGGRQQNEPTAQYEVRPDGTIVRMRCPKCGADRFRSMLGFLNHCRIHCRLVFSSQDDRLQRCGVAIDPSEVPPDYFTKHPSQLKQEMDLALIRADVLGPQSDLQQRPQIKEHPDVFGSSAQVSDHPPAIKAAPTSSAAASTETCESRFYVKRQIIIGNAAKSLLANGSLGKRKGSEEPQTEEAGALITERDEHVPSHKWRLYVSTPKTPRNKDNDHNPAVESYVRGVRFILHPSYRPNDVVDVVQPPFELIRTGWGEFPVRVQIHFWDAQRNKPREIVHLVRIKTATSSKYITAAEQVHQLDVDRRTDFGAKNFLSEEGLPLAPLPSPGKVNKSEASDDELLKMVVFEFPLVGKRGKRAMMARYRPANTLEEFFRLDLKAQMILEANRAAAMCTYLGQQFPSFGMSPEQVVQWCRAHGHTPAAASSFFAAIEESGPLAPEQFQYCRFCGLAHLPQDKFEILQKNCSFRPRKIHVSSRSASVELLDQHELLPETNENFKKLKQDYFGPAFLIMDESIDATSDKFNQVSGLEKSADELASDWTDEQISQLYLPHYQRSNAMQRMTLSNLVTAAMKGFLRRLLSDAVDQIPESKERTPDRLTLLTALHLYRAITTKESYDFLTGAYMAGPKPSANGGSCQTSPDNQ